MDAANHSYYRAMHGRWRGDLRVRVTDVAAFHAAPMGFGDRFRARATAALPLVSMQTSLVYGPEVVHTTRMSLLGLPVFRSVERFVLQRDGRSAELRGEVWYPPIPWPMGDLGEGRVEVDEDALGATYRFQAFGGEVVQKTRVENEDTLQIVQELGWGRGEVVLRRSSRAVD